MSSVWDRLFPETAVGGYSRLDTTVDFDSRVNALVTPDSVVVDFGAGRGGFMDEPDSYRRWLRELKGRCQRFIGVDVDPAVLTNPSVDEALVWQPGTKLELPDESVDVVVSDFTFEHVADPASVVAELERVLKPGGWVCARTPNRWGYIAVGARLVPKSLHAKTLARLQPNRRELDIFPTVYRLNTLGDIRGAFPRPRWHVYAYTMDGKSAYFGKSRLLNYAVYVIAKVLPQRLGAMYLFDIQKLPTDGR